MARYLLLLLIFLLASIPFVSLQNDASTCDQNGWIVCNRIYTDKNGVTHEFFSYDRNAVPEILGQLKDQETFWYNKSLAEKLCNQHGARLPIYRDPDMMLYVEFNSAQRYFAMVPLGFTTLGGLS